MIHNFNIDEVRMKLVVTVQCDENEVLMFENETFFNSILLFW